MISISVSQLKTNPSAAILQSLDYPLAIESRNKVKAYLIGKDLYEKIVSFVEDYIDTSAVEKTDFSKGRDFEEVVKNLGI